MSIDRCTQHVKLLGNILEIFHCEDQVCAKILIRPEYLDVNINNLAGLHLGDHVEVNGILEISNVKSCIGSFGADP